MLVKKRAMSNNVLDELLKYANNVINGNILACEWERLACIRFKNDLNKQNDSTFPFIFDETRAQLIFDFFKLCQQVRGPYTNHPILLQDWQRFDLGNIFGWVHKNTGRRRFKIVYIRIARGNAKSTLMSGIALFGMCADPLYKPNKPEEAIFESMPEVQCCAVDRSQADRVWGDAREIALQSPEIAKRLKVKEHTIKNIKRGGSFLKLSKETKNKDSGAPCIIIVDEYHAHPTSKIKDTIASGKGKRAQCLEFIITTAGDDAENKPCKKEDDIVKKILKNEIEDDSYYGMIRELDVDDDIHDSKNWVKSNPIFRTMDDYGTSVFDQMKTEHDLAFNTNDPSKIREWMIKRANLWQISSEEKYFQQHHMDKWKSLAIDKKDFLKQTKGKECWVGVDLAKCIDLTAVAFVFRQDDIFYVTAHGFMPSNTATRHEQTDRVPYKTWTQQDWCTLTPGDVTDDKFIEQHITKTAEQNGWKIQEVCYDPYNARQFSNNMTNAGYTCVEVRQGVLTLSEPIKRFRECVLQKKILHDGNPLFTWCLSNAYEIIKENDNVLLTKKNKDDSQRIDLLAATIDAFTRAFVLPKSNVYETRGMLSLLD